MNEALSWDEFRLVKAISDSGSLGGAAEILGLNHSTVFRRLAALETTVGARLFERSREGYQPTVAGDEMIALATTMADSIVGFERKLAGRDAQAHGSVARDHGRGDRPADPAGHHGAVSGSKFRRRRRIEAVQSDAQSFAPGCGRRHPPDQRSARKPWSGEDSAPSDRPSIIDATSSPR